MDILRNHFKSIVMFKKIFTSCFKRKLTDFQSKNGTFTFKWSSFSGFLFTSKLLPGMPENKRPIINKKIYIICQSQLEIISYTISQKPGDTQLNWFLIFINVFSRQGLTPCLHRTWLRNASKDNRIHYNLQCCLHWMRCSIFPTVNRFPVPFLT